MVFAPSPGDHLHRMPLKGEPCFTLRRVRGQRVLEAAEGLALLQCLPECTGQAGVAALLGVGAGLNLSSFSRSERACSS